MTTSPAIGMTTDFVAEAITRTSTGEAVTFWVLGTVALISAFGVVMAGNAVYSAMFLATTMIVLAIFYLAQDALFLGVVQVVVYTGAVMMLFLFVLMLIGVDSAESLVETLRGQRVAAFVAGLGFGSVLIGGIGSVATSGFAGLTGANAGGNVEGLAILIFSRYLWAFELTSALLITAAVGAMVLAHRERFERRKTQRELSIERFRSGGYPTPLPGPGVYARHNAVDVAARLPDGSYSRLSVPSVLEPRTADSFPDSPNGLEQEPDRSSHSRRKLRSFNSQEPDRSSHSRRKLRSFNSQENGAS
jgi:NADH-quinone oxidoreductase subunit J